NSRRSFRRSCGLPASATDEYAAFRVIVAVLGAIAGNATVVHRKSPFHRGTPTFADTPVAALQYARTLTLYLQNHILHTRTRPVVPRVRVDSQNNRRDP